MFLWYARTLAGIFSALGEHVDVLGQAARGHHHDYSHFPLEYPGLCVVVFKHKQIVTNRMNIPPPQGRVVAFAVAVHCTCTGLPTMKLSARRSV